MKKSKKILIVFAIIFIIAMSFLIGQVYAKYASQIKGQGSADIASWNFKVNDKESQIQTISLNSTINNKTISNNKIAPGTSGNFKIKIDATDSEVGIGYIIKFENETNKPTNLKFTYENNTYNSISDLQEKLIGTIGANDVNKTKEININWSWPYETGTTKEQILANDKIDTEQGKKLSNYSFDVIVTGTQVMPQA